MPRGECFQQFLLNFPLCFCVPPGFDPQNDGQATYAGVGFGNAGVHLCHGMSYPISGLNKGGPKWVHPDYASDPTPGGMLVPHGIAVVISAPAIFRFTAAVNPERHLQCAEILGADISNAKSDADYAGNLLAEEILKLMDATGVPMGISKLGFSRADIPALVAVRA